MTESVHAIGERLRPDLPRAFRRMLAGGQLFDALPIGIYCCDAEGRLLQFNQRAAELWGRVPPLGVRDEYYCGALKLFMPDGAFLPHARSPMAEVLRTGVPAQDRMVIVERPDGTRVTVLASIEPVLDADGAVAGAVNCFRDITELQRSREALEAKERGLQALLNALPAAIYTTDARGRVTFFNEAAVEMVGCQPVLGEAEWCVSFRLRSPDGEPLAHDECPMAVALKEQRTIRGAEAVAERPDGTRVPFLAFPTPLYDDEGRLTGAVNMLVDITERKEAEETQGLLIRELNHRVRNTLAMVQAIARRTLSRSADPAAFVASFTGRVQALARAHALLTESTWRGAELMALVRDQLLLGRPDDGRIACSGPSLVLKPQPALHLAMALHELGTNARKYGALSMPEGCVSVSWKVRSRPGRELLLDWRESGGPAVSAPASRGFGTSLVEQSMQVHGGEACFCYSAEGVTCAIRLPLADSRGTSSAAGETLMTSARQVARDTLAGRRVLVIEDEPLVSMDIMANLAREGCSIIGPAGTVGRARQLIESEPLDAALVDANLAGEPVDEIAAALTQRGVPFAFVTGYGRQALPKAFASAPMISKPFEARHLSDTLRQLLQTDPNVVRLRQETA